MSLKLDEDERDVRVELERDDGYDHWLDIKHERYEGLEDTFVVVKDDSKPTYNEKRYWYTLEENRLEFEQGKQSDSGTGKFSKTTPDTELDGEIREAIEEHYDVKQLSTDDDGGFDVPVVPRVTRAGALNTAVDVIQASDESFDSTDKVLAEAERLADNIVLDIERNSREGRAKIEARENHGGKDE